MSIEWWTALKTDDRHVISSLAKASSEDPNNTFKRGIQPNWNVIRKKRRIQEDVLTKSIRNIQTVIAHLVYQVMEKNPYAEDDIDAIVTGNVALELATGRGADLMCHWQENRHHLCLLPMDPDRNDVIEKLKILAQIIKRTIDEPDYKLGINLTEEDIYTMLLINAAESASTVNMVPMLQINGNEKGISVAKLHQEWGKVAEQVANGQPEDIASLDLCRRIGVQLNTQPERALEEIQKIKEIAWKFIQEILSYANEVAIRDESMSKIRRLGLNHTLQTESLFRWVAIMFDKNADPQKRLEVQTLLKVALEISNTMTSASYKNSTVLKRRTSSKIQDCFEEDTFLEVKMDRIIFREDGKVKEIRKEEITDFARRLKDVPEGFSGLVIFDEFDNKEVFPIIQKILTKEPGLSTHDIRDHLRCTLTLPDITMKQMLEEKETKNYAHKILKNMGEKLGLRYKENPPINVGEFTIEENLEEKLLFKNLKLIGKLPNRIGGEEDPTTLGTTVEIQLQTKDLAEAVMGANSPFNHAHYERLRKIETARRLFSSTEIHESLQREESRIKKRRKNAITALTAIHGANNKPT